MTNFKMIDATVYKKDDVEKLPTCWRFRHCTGFWYKVYATKRCPGTWFLECPVLNINMLDLEASDFRKASKRAEKIIREKLEVHIRDFTIILKDLKSI